MSKITMERCASKVGSLGVVTVLETKEASPSEAADLLFRAARLGSFWRVKPNPGNPQAFTNDLMGAVGARRERYAGQTNPIGSP